MRVCRIAPGDVEPDHVLALARAVRTADGVATFCPRPAGLLAELTERPDRRVEAWLALADLGADVSPGRGVAAGLVSLVSGRGSTGVRCSISWLVVHPEFRRQGLGRLLVERACGHAWAQAAGAVWVECRSDWATAVAFWTAVGFSADVPRPG